MGSLRSAGTLGAAVLLVSLGAPTPRAGAQAGGDPARPHKSVYGALEKADQSLNGVIMRSNEGERLAWRFPAAVVAEVARFKPGDPMIVIYRQISPSEKRVTAVAFPGAAPTALYVNMTGARVLLRSAPDVSGACGQPDAGPATDQMIPSGGMGEAGGACWCCALAAGSCVPGNKTGIGKALLVSCFE
jgi:hypothetical protein